MTTATDEPVPAVPPMEEFFARVGQGLDGPAPPSVHPGAIAASEALLRSAEVPESPDDSEWLRVERRRLQEYTTQRFAVLRQMHEAFLAERLHIEEHLAIRSQEVSQQMAQLAAGHEDLRRGQDAVAQREAVVAAGEQRLAEAQTRLEELEAAGRQLEGDIAERRRQLAQLETDKSRIEPSLQEAQAALLALQDARAQSEQAWQTEQEAIAERRRQAEERYAALEKAEADALRRQHELDEHDARLNREHQERLQALEAERQELNALHAKYLEDVAILETDPELPRIVNSWAKLPDYVKQTVRMLISAAK